MFSKQIPDLDLLESPLISANPFGSMLGSVPQSALVEQIFNDPEAWSGVGEEEPSPRSSGTIENTKDAMIWLADELDKYHSQEDFPFSPADDPHLRPFSERFKLVPTNPLTVDGVRWEGVVDSGKPSYLPIFRQSKRVNLNPHLSQYFDLSALVSPVSSRSERPLSKSSLTPLNLPNIPPPLDLTITSPLSPSPAPTASASASASTTWSILEMYGVTPETPRHSARTSILSPYTSKNYLSVPLVPSMPAQFRSTPSTPTTIKPKVKPKIVTASPQSAPDSSPELSQDSTPLRRLPSLPGPTRSSPPSTPPSPPPPYVKTPERKRTPGRRTRSSAKSDVTPPIPHRSFSVNRSPPIGPRPRSTGGGSRRCASHGNVPRREPSELPFTVSPAPRLVRRSPSPLPATPPKMRLNVHC